MEDLVPNCIGFTFYKLGLIEAERAESQPLYRDLVKYFRVTVAKNGDENAIAAISRAKKFSRVTHLAIVDPDDREFVIQRKHRGAPVCRVTREAAFSFYKQQEYLIVNLKLSKKS